MGPGGVRARSLGEDVCLFVANQIVESLPSRLVAVFSGDALRLAHVLAIVPDAPPLSEADDPEGEPEDDSEADPDPEGEADEAADEADE